MVLGPADHVPSARKLAAFEQLGGTSELVERTMFSTEGGQAAGTKLVRRGATAAVCASDVLALGVIRGVHREGLRVPDAFSVVGFDDSTLMASTDPPLTTVRQPIESMGRSAVSTLLSLVGGEAVSSEELLFAPELVVRASTGAAAAARPRPLSTAASG
jgi:DNA-binding LacI/PurR family transcriptional regulator